jgi:hypothetical protein
MQAGREIIHLIHPRLMSQMRQPVDDGIRHCPNPKLFGAMSFETAMRPVRGW